MNIKEQRIVFLGTPEFAVEPLNALVKAGFNVAAAISQPDKPVGRKAVLEPTPVKAAAQRLGIPVFQFDKIRSAEGQQKLVELNADLGVVAAFGQLMSRENIAAPRLGMINIHGSLLPKYRGASPIQSAVMDGLKTTGISVQQVKYEMDTGDILYSRDVEIGENETSGELFERMSKVSAQLLPEVVELVLSGRASPTKQDDSAATYCSMLTKQTGVIDWNKSAYMINALIRGTNPWPVAQCAYGEKVLKVYSARVLSGEGKPGEVLVCDGKRGLVVACGEGALELTEVQTAGGKRMSADAFVRGSGVKMGDILT